MKTTEAIRNFLTATALPANHDLASRYAANMEVQVIVSPEGGELVAGRNAYSNGPDIWHPIRIPKHADSEPEWHDHEISWVLDEHATGIGMTGWDWQNRKSLWVAFDVDALVSHAAGVGITEAELEVVKEKAATLPYIEVRRSTGGTGLHLYAYLSGIPAENHTIHAALARCILGMMSTEVGFNFASRIDACGGVMWVWHKKITAENRGLEIIKPATKQLSEADLPPNWKDHVEVVQGRRSKVRIASVENEDPFETLASSQRRVPLDTIHKSIIDTLSQTGFSTVWVQDYHLLQTHTKALEQVAQKLQLKGVYTTNSRGNDPGTPNCFAFPLDDGAWRVYRFTPGASEATTWEQDGSGWTNCYYNRTPDLNTAAKLYDGVEAPNKAGFVFQTATAATKAIEALGHTFIPPEGFHDRETRLKTQKDGRIVVTIKRDKDESAPQGWLEERGKAIKVLNIRAEVKAQIMEDNYSECDKLVRALVSPEGKRAGWAARSSEGDWIEQPKDDIKSALAYHGKTKPEIDSMAGLACVKPWRLVSLPFQPEYPGGRQWNRKAVQYLHRPADTSEPHHPHWDMILNHVFGELTSTLKELDWAKQANITTGATYGLAWMACLLREPLEKLPYLFLFGEENSGKSIFHESFQHLISKQGIASANLALTNSSGFNGELIGAVLAYIEEINIAATPHALPRIKEWLLSRTLPIRQMRMDMYSLPNTLHFVQIANDPSFCLVLPGDTRITMIHVPPLPYGTEIPKHKMEEFLSQEAPHFMRTIMDFPLPPIFSRLRLPVVETSSKFRAQETHRTPIEQFIVEHCHIVPGTRILFKEFYDKFLDSLAPDERGGWSKQKIKKQLPDNFPVGAGAENKMYVGNLSWEPHEATKPWIAVDGRLKVQE